MLSLQEHIEIDDKLKLFEGEQTEFTDQQLDDAEFFRLRQNPVSYDTEMTLFNAQEEPLGTVSFSDADIAIAFLEELFDLEADDIADLEDYVWVNDDMDDEFEELATNAQTVNNID